MNTTPQSPRFLSTLRQAPLQPSSRAPARGKGGLTCAAALLALLALTACEGPGGGLLTGVPAGPAGSVIPTENTSTLEVRINNPANGATVSGTVSIEVETKERDVQRARTDLFIGEVLVASSTSERFAYSWSTASYSGSQSITAVGWDVEGNSALATITVTVASSGTGPSVLSVAVNPHLVTGGDPSTGTVGLTSAAPSGGTSVALASSNTAVATVPASVTVPAGQTTATFAVSTMAVGTTTEVTISATAGGATQTATLTLAPATDGGGTLDALSIAPDLVVGGESSQGTVTLAAAVGSDTPVTLISSDESVATVPASVTVPAGATSAVFPITTLVNNTGVSQFSVISGHAGGVTRSASITTVPPPSGPAVSAVNLFPSSLGGGGPVTGIVTFDAPLTDGVILSFTSSHPDIVQVPAEGVQVIWSSTERAFPVTTSPVSSNTVVTITATACCGGVGQGSGTLTVTTDPPPPPDGVAITDARWTPGGTGGTLEVRATSTSQTAILTVFRGGTDIKLLVLTHVGDGKYQGSQSFGGGATNPGTIDVRSNLGGTDTAAVRE